jgi:predicted nucleic acid-binding protein
MILIDSSVWIDYFNNKISFETDLLNFLLESERLIIGDLILLEVLQGFRNDKDFKDAKRILDSLHKLDIAGHEISILSANNYRILRKKGITVRKTIDVIIATFCIKNNYKLLYSDRDFDVMVKHLGLKSFNSN